MELTRDDKAALYRDGFVMFPGAVRQELVAAARRAINGSLGENGMPPEELPTLRARSYCPELTGSPEILALLTQTPMWSIAESAIGTDQLSPVSRGQIALRFPQPGQARAPHPHIDGMHTPTNGVPAGTIANFTALVAVFLSDVDRAYAGNFTAWPGTHRQYEEYFRGHGPQALIEGMPNIGLPEPVQVTANAGDAMLCHYQLGHGIAGNASPNIRYAVFFRIFRQGHDEIRWECMTDIWREWDGMRDVLPEPAVTS